jgi:hypothetical protein
MLLDRRTLSGEDIDALLQVMTSNGERARLERIEAARQVDRDALAWRFGEM